MKTACTMLIAICLLQACSYYEMKEETAKREKTWKKPSVEVVESNSYTHSTAYSPGSAVMDDPFNYHPQPSEFTIDPTTDNVITGEKGTVVYIPAGSLDATGKNVLFSMTEYTNERDLFLSQLTTMSNQKPLISGGSVHLTAWSDGKEIQLKKGKAMTVIFKREKDRKDDMMTFYGTRTANGSMDWPTFTPSWKENFYENGFHEMAQQRQDSLFPRIKELRDSIMQSIALSPQQNQWLNQESNCEKNPKFYLRKDEDKFYRLDTKNFTYNFGAQEIQHYAVGFFRQLINDSLVQQLNETVSFSPAIERKPFYEGEKEWINSLVKNVKGDTNNAAKFMVQYALMNYILRSTQMGYINCDRFYTYPNTDQEILVDLPKNFKGKLQLLIPAVNGVYEASPKDENTWCFSGLPKGLPFTMIAFTPVNGKISASIEKGRTGNRTYQDLHFTKYPCTDFVAMVKSFR